MNRTMTKADRHREEGIARMQDGDICPHGRPAGFSNYDVMFCGTCEREMADEAAEENWNSLTDAERAEIQALLDRLDRAEAKRAAEREAARNNDCPF